MTRLIAGAAVLVALVLGGSRSGGLTDEEGEQAQALLAREVPPERAREAALTSQPKYTSNAVYYRSELEATLAKLDMQVGIFSGST